MHSVFRRAANLWFPPDTLLAITAPAAMRVPNGVVVASPLGSPDGPFLGLDVAMTALVGDGLIRVPATGLCIDVADVALWEPRLRFPDRPIAPAVFSQHLDRLAMLMRGTAWAKPWSFASVLDPLVGQPPGAGALKTGEEARLGHLTSRARPAVSDQLSGIASGEIDRIATAARGLAGLGRGLTPSGDDFLIGVCGALHLADAALPPGSTRDGVGTREDQLMAIATAAVGRTTLLSAIWLDYAARGEFSAEVGDVLVSLIEPNAAGLDETIARLLAVGGMSGLDTAMGVLQGSRAALESCRRHAAGA